MRHYFKIIMIIIIIIKKLWANAVTEKGTGKPTGKAAGLGVLASSSR